MMLVGLCTFLIAAGQISLKYGLDGRLVFILLGMLLIGIAAIMVTYAFKHGELSALHALFGLGFLWAALASVVFLGERLGLIQVAGILIIIAGVGLISHSGRRR
jgi:drug/metabolite transporter (DMT)-like permease